jgi:DNA-directed RNA polymerase subunit RPC12/RpoP
MAQKFYLWGKKLVVILRAEGNRAFIKVVKGGPADKLSVSMGDLTPLPIQKEPVQSIKAANLRLQCPECGLQYPHYQQGVECPACGYRLGAVEEMHFKEWLKHI